jgi:cysteine desulfurase
MGFFKSFSKSHVSTKGPRIYLDFASSTPLDQGMLGTFPPLSEYALQANPSALHYEGQQAKKSLKDARAVVAEALFAHDDEVIFTSNATESDNLALHGTVLAAIKNNVAKNEIAIITTDSEHSAVLETVKALSPDIATIILETDNGILDARSIEIPEGMKLVIVSVMYVNNEIGVVQPVYDIAKRIRFLRKNNPDVTILLHVVPATRHGPCSYHAGRGTAVWVAAGN